MTAWIAGLLATMLYLVSSAVSAPQSHHLSVVGATGSLAYLRHAVAGWEEGHPGYTVSLSGGGSVAGLVEVSRGRADVGVSDIAPRSEWTAGQPLSSRPLGRLPILLIAHGGTGVKSVAKSGAQALLTGKVRSWQEVGGAPVPVLVMTRPLASGARDAVQQKILGGQRITRSAIVELSNGAMLAAVRETPGAIGFIEAGRPPAHVRVLGIGSHQFSSATAGEWPYFVVPTLYWRSGNAAAASLAQYLATRSYRSGYGLVPLGMAREWFYHAS